MNLLWLINDGASSDTAIPGFLLSIRRNFASAKAACFPFEKAHDLHKIVPGFLPWIRLASRRGRLDRSERSQAQAHFPVSRRASPPSLQARAAERVVG